MMNRGQRSWSVGLSIADITNSILTNRMKTHSVSTLAQVKHCAFPIKAKASFLFHVLFYYI